MMVDFKRLVVLFRVKSRYLQWIPSLPEDLLAQWKRIRRTKWLVTSPWSKGSSDLIRFGFCRVSSEPVPSTCCKEKSKGWVISASLSILHHHSPTHFYAIMYTCMLFNSLNYKNRRNENCYDLHFQELIFAKLPRANFHKTKKTYLEIEIVCSFFILIWK